MRISTQLLRRTVALPALILSILCMACGALHAQVGSMNYVYAYNQFAYDDSLTLVEVNIQFSNLGLAYGKIADGTLQGRLLNRLVVSDTLGKNADTISWISVVEEPSQDADAMMMMGSRSLAVKPGVYKAQVFYQDLGNRSRKDSITFLLPVRSFAGDALQVSDIEVVTQSMPSTDTANQFYKNGYMVLPNVTSVIAPPSLTLDSYVEVYNADKLPGSEYKLQYALATSEKKVFYHKEVTFPRPPHGTAISLNTTPLDSMPNGVYYVIVRAFPATGAKRGDTAIVYHAFTLHNPDRTYELAMGSGKSGATATAISQRNSVTEIDPIYSGLNNAELDLEYAKARYIATDNEKQMWESLSGVEAKERFLSNFWAARDDSPDTPENENREAYYSLVEEARVQYAAPLAKHGWDSDRGRVLLQYGKPDGVERHVQDNNKKPYEIWSYNKLTYDFVFVDRTQTGLYKLVHSTAPREIHHDNWLEDYTLLNKNWDN
ncbi:MAG: hypothetical protein JWQ98_2345 [Chlorobi bacterium]|nr:hypothetical protein [Chlorobiota bacterium]